MIQGSFNRGDRQNPTLLFPCPDEGLEGLQLRLPYTKETRDIISHNDMSEIITASTD